MDISPPDFPGKLSGLAAPALVFFHKQGCSPCSAVMAQIEEVSRRFPALAVFRVNITGGAHGTEGYTRGGTPLVVLFDKRGLEEWRWRGGSVTADRMSTRIQDVLR